MRAVGKPSKRELKELPRFLDQGEAAALLRVSTETLRQWRSDPDINDILRPSRLSSKKFIYELDNILRFVALRSSGRRRPGELALLIGEGKSKHGSVQTEVP